MGSGRFRVAIDAPGRAQAAWNTRVCRGARVRGRSAAVVPGGAGEVRRGRRGVDAGVGVAWGAARVGAVAREGVAGGAGGVGARGGVGDGQKTVPPALQQRVQPGEEGGEQQEEGAPEQGGVGFALQIGADLPQGPGGRGGRLDGMRGWGHGGGPFCGMGYLRTLVAAH